MGQQFDFTQIPLRFNDPTIDESKYSQIYPGGKAHKGFLDAYNSVSDTINKWVQQIRNGYPDKKLLIRIGGHSLGGSLATLSAAHLAMNHLTDKNSIQLETYGSPRTLGESVSGELTKRLGKDNIMRFVNVDKKRAQDMVTDIPKECLRPSISPCWRRMRFDTRRT